ncbi:MAG: hypothetical protein K8L97_34070 [Anaerolineae bacterium]|nr:hypothetical protein [Anaerolineae bacterium]
MAASQTATPKRFTKLKRAWAVLSSPRQQPIIYAEIALLVLGGLALLPGGFDYQGYFHRLAQGCEACTYNPYFSEWFMFPLGVFAWRVGYLVLCGLTMAIAYWSARRLGGKPFVVLTSPTFLWILWLGQIDIIAAFGLAIAWWNTQRGKPIWVGLGLLMMATKPQLAAFAIIALVLWNGWKSLIIPAAGAALSFVIYGLDWPVRWLSYTPQTMFAGDAWFYIAPTWLLIGLLGVFFIKGRQHQLQYVIAATLAGAPYLGAYSFFTLTLFPLRWWEILVAYAPFAMMGITGDQWWLGLLLAQPLMVMGRLLYENYRPLVLPKTASAEQT